LGGLRRGLTRPAGDRAGDVGALVRVREEIERRARPEAGAVLQTLAEFVAPGDLTDEEIADLA
jgi:hypothetical protein